MAHTNINIVTPAQRDAQRTTEVIRKYRWKLNNSGVLSHGARMQYLSIVRRAQISLNKFYAKANAP